MPPVILSQFLTLWHYLHLVMSILPQENLYSELHFRNLAVCKDNVDVHVNIGFGTESKLAQNLNLFIQYQDETGKTEWISEMNSSSY